MILEKKNYSNLKIILVEPNGPLNVGSVARLCSNFEVDELRIVSPKCDIFSLEAKKMALKGQKFLDNCKIFHNLENAICDCDLVLASCGRINVSKDSFFESSEDIFNWTISFKQIIKQVTGGLTPPMPSFEIDPLNMSNLLKYLHSLE